MKNKYVLLTLSFMILLPVPSYSLESEKVETEKEVRITYGCLWPAEHFGRDVAKKFAERVNKETNGKILVEITPPTSDVELTQKLIKGEIQMTSGRGIEQYVPEIGLTYFPYLYNTFEHFRAAWALGGLPSDTIIRCVEQKLPAVKIFGYSLIGFRDIILRNNKISTIEDIENLRIRVDGSNSSISTFNAFGATPVTIEYHKVKESLHNGEVDAAENSPFNLIYMGWYEECKNVSLTNHLIILHIEMINAEFWAKLSKAYQDVIYIAMQDGIKEFSDIALGKRNEAIKELSDKYKIPVTEISPLMREQLESKVIQMKLEFIKRYNLEKEYDYIIDLGKNSKFLDNQE